MSKICIVGTGYVGLVVGSCFADLGNDVVCLDIDTAKIDNLNAGDVPIFEPGLEDLLRRNRRAGRLVFTSSYEMAVPTAEFVFIAVDTASGRQPSNNGSGRRSSVAARRNCYKPRVSSSMAASAGLCGGDGSGST